jgi:hypothetical protein
MKVDALFEDLYPLHMESPPVIPTDFDCYRKLIRTYQEHCGNNISEYSFKYFGLFAAECERVKSVPDALVHSVQRIEDACQQAYSEEL